MRVLDRSFQPISVAPTPDRRGLELRISGEGGQSDATTILTPQDARLLAYGLLAAAETLGPS